MAKYQHCPEGCPWLKADTLFTWRCMRPYDDCPTWTLYAPMLKNRNDKPVRTTHCVRESLPEGVKEADPC